MKKIYNLLIVLAIPALFLVFTSEVMYPGGSPGGRTGSPGDNGANCTGCHSGTPINEEEWIVSGLIGTGYSPGETYPIFVIGMDPEASKFGFEATAENASGEKVGTFIPGVLGMTQLSNNNSAVTHTLLGNNPLADTGTIWMFNWTAPSESMGDITFYAAINAANGNGGTSGDMIHLSQFTASPAVGISDNYTTKAINFYPNPATDYIHVEANENIKENSFMDIINLHGQLVERVELSGMKQTVDISAFDPGIYFIRAGNVTERLVIR